MIYKVQVALTDVRQVEIESDKPLEWPEIKRLAEEKARREYGVHDEIDAD